MKRKLGKAIAFGTHYAGVPSRHLRTARAEKKPFLGVFFARCKVYGRLYLNGFGTAYEGRCPKCREYFSVKIGSGGTHNRFFKAFCR